MIYDLIIYFYSAFSLTSMMDKKTLYYKLLDDMEKILKKHKKTQSEWEDFDPTKMNPVDLSEDIKNPEQWAPFGSLKTSIEILYRDSIAKTEC